MCTIKACWSPCWCYNNVKQGTIATGIYSVLLGLLAFLYCIWVMSNGEASEVYTPFFESDIRNTTQTAGGFGICFSIVFIICGAFLLFGVGSGARGFFLPWMLYMLILVIVGIAYGIFLIARYYTYDISILAACYTWVISGFHYYSLMCVFSYYKLLTKYQATNEIVLYP